MSKEKVSYKEALEEIEGIVAKVENGECEVDELAEMVKKAIALIKSCQEKLRRTEDDLNETMESFE